MDPADVRKVMREETPELDQGSPIRWSPPVRRKLFGGWEGNWMAYNTAHDIGCPGASGAKLGFLMYPQAENAQGPARQPRPGQLQVHDHRARDHRLSGMPNVCMFLPMSPHPSVGRAGMHSMSDAVMAPTPLDLAGRHVVLGLSGGIACYKSAELVRELTKAGATVQVVMTEAAEHFITAVTMQALSGRAVVTSQWDAREPNNMAHINLTRAAHRSSRRRARTSWPSSCTGAPTIC